MALEQQCLDKIHQLGPDVDHYLIDAVDTNSTAKVIVTNSILSDRLTQKFNVVQTNDSFYGMYYVPYSLEFGNPTWNYNCLINRMDPIRQSWFYQLVRRNILSQGLVSFNMDVSRHGTEQTDPMTIFCNQYQQYLTIFESEHQQALSLVPYKNFQESGDMTEIVMDSKFSIVLETYFDDNEIITYSEKIFRCLQLPRPWLLFGPRYAVKYLNNMGFDTLGDLVNHNEYDGVESAIQRQTILLDLTEQLCKVDIQQYRNRLIDAARHNQMILKTYSNRFQTDFDVTLEQIKEKLSCIT